MKMYHYKRPLLKLSASSISILDNTGNSIGSIKRTFRNRLSKGLCWVFDNWELSFAGHDTKSGTGIKIMDSNIWFGRTKWYVCIVKDGIENKFLLQDKSKIKTHPRLQFMIDSQNYEVSKDLLNRKTKIVNSTSNITLCEIEHESISSYNHRIIKSYEDTFSPIFFACVDHLLKTMY